jgi:hypothetical protein
MENHMTEHHHDRPSASKYIEEQTGIYIQPSQLAKMAHGGGGPPYVIVCRKAWYAQGDLDKWIAARLARKYTSTSDKAA